VSTGSKEPHLINLLKYSYSLMKVVHSFLSLHLGVQSTDTSVGREGVSSVPSSCV
jgi:hypothetical protein